MRPLMLSLVAMSLFFGGCGTLDKLSRLNEKSTVEECIDLTTEIVAKACRNIGDARDRAQHLLDNVNIAVDTVPAK